MCRYGVRSTRQLDICLSVSVYLYQNPKKKGGLVRDRSQCEFLVGFALKHTNKLLLAHAPTHLASAAPHSGCKSKNNIQRQASSDPTSIASASCRYQSMHCTSTAPRVPGKGPNIAAFSSLLGPLRTSTCSQRCRPTSRHSGLVFYLETTAKETPGQTKSRTKKKRKEKKRGCMHTGPGLCQRCLRCALYCIGRFRPACKPARLSLAYDDDSLLALSARQNTRKNGVNPVCSARILYKIRCENWTLRTAQLRLCTPADNKYCVPASAASPFGGSAG